MTMDLPAALMHLRDNPNGVECADDDEENEAGLWGAACALLRDYEDGERCWTEEDVDELIRQAAYN